MVLTAAVHVAAVLAVLAAVVLAAVVLTVAVLTVVAHTEVVHMVEALTEVDMVVVDNKSKKYVGNYNLNVEMSYLTGDLNEFDSLKVESEKLIYNF